VVLELSTEAILMLFELLLLDKSLILVVLELIFFKGLLYLKQFWAMFVPK